MRHVALALAFVVAGCAQTLLPQLPASPSEIYIREIKDQPALDADFAACRTYAGDFKTGVSLSKITEGTIKGGAGNAAGAAVNPLVPLLGAAGGGLTELVNGLDILTTTQRHILIDCLEKKSARSGAYLVLEPKD